MNEFDIIAKYFRPLTRGHDSLQNDAAVLQIPEGHELIVTSDTLNAGTHFMEDAMPEQIAGKALRVNISDIYAMGADPFAYQLNIAFPEKPSEDWLKKFTGALLEEQKRFNVFCSGGDTTTIKGSLSLSITMVGLVQKGKAWTRSGSKEGHDILLTGPIGDAWIGLQILQEKLKTEDDAYFIEQYYKPSLNPAHGDIHAAIDISDGLIADLNHICTASNVSAHIKLSDIPFSPEAQKLINNKSVTPENLLTGGDDYKLILAIPGSHTVEGAIKIGHFTKGPAEVIVYDAQDQILPFTNPGWTHF